MPWGDHPCQDAGMLPPPRVSSASSSPRREGERHSAVRLVSANPARLSHTPAASRTLSSMSCSSSLTCWAPMPMKPRPWRRPQQPEHSPPATPRRLQTPRVLVLLAPSLLRPPQTARPVRPARWPDPRRRVPARSGPTRPWHSRSSASWQSVLRPCGEVRRIRRRQCVVAALQVNGVQVALLRTPARCHDPQGPLLLASVVR